MSVQVAITAYGNPPRLARIFEAFDMVGWPAADVFVIEDLSTDATHEGYVEICRRYGVSLTRMPEWGCMNGSAQAAFEQATADWVIYYPDDVLPTPGALDSAIRWCSVFDLPEHAKWRIGAFQLPYWNYQTDDGLFPGHHRDECFGGKDLRWLLGVPYNPHWYGPAYYVNVNGAGFVARRQAWKDAGGFSAKTWCLDEHLSCRLWLNTDWGIVTVPGAPIVHAGGLSTPDQHRDGHAHLRIATIAGWLDEWHESKESLGEKCRMRMRVEQKRTGLVAR